MRTVSRVTKEPDIRKQEILYAAMELFATKGYEKTTIADIARYLNISQGLCYRYFTSKDEIFDTGLEQYADYFVEAYKSGLCSNSKSLKEIIFTSPTYIDLEKSNDVYYRFYHKQENKRFHELLSLKVCEKMYPIFCDILVEANAKKEIYIEHPRIAASFLLYGQLGILLDAALSDIDKVKEIRLFIHRFLEKFACE